ncbi:MAG TPA: ABC transporter permease subunit [Candidatus Saccharimonadales bacterium]|nr:ABC transporter permease subunit [Candidatus Saccharimonadales bacterium]
MIPVIKWTLWQRRWFIFWWTFGIAAFMVISLAFYPTFRDQAAQFNQVLAHLSTTAKALFTDTGSFSTPEDFLSGRVFYLMLPLLLSIMSVIVGSSIIAKEEESGTLELLLARPLSRARLIVAKAIAAIIILTSVAIAALVTALLVGHLVHLGVSVINIEVATLFAAILSLLFGAVAFMISSIGRSARAAGAGIAAFIALGSYIIVSLSSVVSWLRWPSKVLPHNYYHPSEILYGNYSWHNAVGLLLATLILGVFAWRVFDRRDLG